MAQGLVPGMMVLGCRSLAPQSATMIIGQGASSHQATGWPPTPVMSGRDLTIINRLYAPTE
jgi:hypothetical protein